MDFARIDNAWECIVAVVGIAAFCFCMWLMMK